jgi:hypothetical protein
VCPGSALPSPPNSPVGNSGLSLLTPVPQSDHTTPADVAPNPHRAITLSLPYIEKSQHSLPEKELMPCAIGTIKLRRFNSSSKTTEYRTFQIPCKKSGCPDCAKRRARKLRSRLRQIQWPPFVHHWMITHDPKLSTVRDNLHSISRRWNKLNRTLHRLAPHVRYFKCLELKDGWHLHFHLLTADYIPYDAFCIALRRAGFGFAKYTTIPRDRAIRYTTKYVTKGIVELNVPENWPVKFWSASLTFLPFVVWIPEHGTWSPVLLIIGSFVRHFEREVNLNHSPPSSADI